MRGRRKWPPCVPRIYRAPLELAVAFHPRRARIFRSYIPFRARVRSYVRVCERAYSRTCARTCTRDMRSCRNSPGDVNSPVLSPFLFLSHSRSFFLPPSPRLSAPPPSLSLTHPPTFIATLRVDFRVHPLIADRSTSRPISLAIVAAASSDNILQSGEGDHPYEKRRPPQWRSSAETLRWEMKLRVLIILDKTCLRKLTRTLVNIESSDKT